MIGADALKGGRSRARSRTQSSGNDQKQASPSAKTSGGEHAASSRCLVLGYDRTESSRHAASWAVKELLPDGKLVIVHASRPLHEPRLPLSTAHERVEFGRALIGELFLEGSDSLFNVDIEAEISDRDPVSALIDAAGRHSPWAIVIGHERHSRVRQALGTVASELLAASPVPVIAVPLSAS